MESVPSVLVLDDGELDDVHAILVEMEVPFQHLRGEAAAGRLEEPGSLIVATVRRALGAEWLPGSEQGAKLQRIAVCNEDSRSVRNRLRMLGYGFVVRRPVHPAALRMLLLHALYRGPERRVHARVPVGAGVQLRVGMRKRPAVLAEISEGGCRLLANLRPALGSRITVQIPPEMAGGRGLSLKARLVRSAAKKNLFLGTDSELAVVFEGLPTRTRLWIQTLVQDARAGGASFGGAAGENPPELPAVDLGPPGASAHSRDRRRSPRHTYERHVIALGQEAAQVVMGRDFSATGMGMDYRPGIRVGDQLKLAVYGEAGSVPVILEARVMRADPKSGIGLRFDKSAVEVTQRLEEIVSVLPPIEPLAEDENESLGTVVTQILPSDS